LLLISALDIKFGNFYFNLPDVTPSLQVSLEQLIAELIPVASLFRQETRIFDGNSV